MHAFTYDPNCNVVQPTYDRANNKLIEEKRHDTGNSEVYSYDSAYRLGTFNRGTLNTGKTAISTATAITGALQAQSWTLDGLGNWVSNVHTESNTANTENRTHSDFNEIVAVSGTPYAGGATGTQLLDKDGNMTDDLTKTYKWDALNRLREVRDKGTGNLLGTYFYDCGNRRIQKVVTNSGSLNGTTAFYYDGWRVMEEHDGSDNDLRQYTYGNYLDEVWTLDNRRTSGGASISVASLNDGSGAQRLFFHSNTLYSVFALTDETGAIAEGYMYDAYGRQSITTAAGSDTTWFTNDDAWTVGGNSAVGNPFTWEGQRLDPESSNGYFKTRYFSYGLGRFLSRQPWGKFGPYKPNLRALFNNRRQRRHIRRVLSGAVGNYIQHRYGLYEFGFGNPRNFKEPYSNGEGEGNDDDDENGHGSKPFLEQAGEELIDWATGQGNYKPQATSPSCAKSAPVGQEGLPEDISPPSTQPPAEGSVGQPTVTAEDDDGSDIPVVKQPPGGKNPMQGPPRTVSVDYDKDGNVRQIRMYGDDGWATADIDFGHGHEYEGGSPHYHQWTPNPNGGMPTRETGIPVTDAPGASSPETYNTSNGLPPGVSGPRAPPPESK